MTVPTFTPDPAPSPGSEIKVELKLKEAGFGDGYTQTTRDGANHLRRVVTLKWDALNAAMAQTLQDFFEERAGDQPFLYTVYGSGVERQWLCKDWSRLKGTPETFTATLRQDFNLS